MSELDKESASKADVVKAIGGSSPSSSASTGRIIQISKTDLVKEMESHGINLNGVTLDCIMVRSCDVLIVDGVVVKNRDGAPGANVSGSIVVDEERDEL